MKDFFMPRITCVILLAVFALMAPLYAHAQSAPSPAVKRILDKAVSEVKKNRQVFDRANDPALADARKAIEDLAKKMIEDGKADEAGAVLKQVSTLEIDVMRMANAPEPNTRRAATQKPLLERMVGKWTHPTSPLIYHFEPNGTFHENFKTDGRMQSQGRVAVNPRDEQVADINPLSNGFRLQVRMAGDNHLALLVWDPGGQPVGTGIVLERIK